MRPMYYRIATVIDFYICRNLPFDGRVMGGSQVRLPRKKNARSRHQRLFKENVRKPKTGLRILRIKGSGVVYVRGRY